MKMKKTKVTKRRLVTSRVQSENIIRTIYRNTSK